MNSQGSSDTRSPLEPIVELFQRHGVEFIVIGGMAEVLHGGLRPTYDVDLCYSRTDANLKRLAGALNEIHPKLRGPNEDLPFKVDARSLALGSNFTFETDHGALDLLGWVEPIGEYEAVKQHCASVNLGGTSILVLSVDGLIRIKEHINRDKDKASLTELRAIKREEESGQ